MSNVLNKENGTCETVSPWNGTLVIKMNKTPENNDMKSLFLAGLPGVEYGVQINYSGRGSSLKPAIIFSVHIQN